MIFYNAAFEIALNDKKHLKSIREDQSRSLFLTYYYKRLTCRALDSMSLKNNDRIITIDSGAHSFFGEKKAGVRYSPYDIDMYMASYLSFMHQYKDKVDYFVELDIQDLVGFNKVRSWRQALEREGLLDKIIFCIHSIDTDSVVDETIELAESSSKYIGLEGFRGGGFVRPNNNAIIKTCYEKGIRTHGFAMTKPSVIVEYPYFSVDSSSWNSPIRYGRIMRVISRNDGLKYISTKRSRVKRYEDDLLYANAAELFHAYGELQDFYTEYLRRKGIIFDKRFFKESEYEKTFIQRR